MILKSCMSRAGTFTIPRKINDSIRARTVPKVAANAGIFFILS